MDRERAKVEDVPPLELRKLRDLELEEPSGPERPAHVAAGSGVVRRGDYAYVIGDDELFIARLLPVRSGAGPARAGARRRVAGGCEGARRR